MNPRNLLSIFFCLSSVLTFGQQLLIEEDFNNCALPEGWTLEVTNGMDAGVIFGYMLNTKSDSLTVDGTCMVIFDDDLLGNNLPQFKAELRTPVLDVTGFTNIDLSLDLAFRAYGTSSFEMFVVADSQYYSIARYSEGNSTGAQMSQAIRYTSDLSFVTDANEIQIAFVYDDDHMYAWWAGLDNVRVTGENKGEVVLKESFNDCELPIGWESLIFSGVDPWQFGLVENGNASSNSMNGSCFAYFDDDGIGEDAAISTVELRTPVFDGSAYAEFEINFDLIFRKAVDFENISVFVYDGNEYYLVEEFINAVAGNQFSSFESIALDLSKYRTPNMQVAFRYEDGGGWGWWVGLENIKIIGNGQINDLCSTAEPLIVNTPCTRVNNSNAIQSGPPASCSDEIRHTLWYTFSADRDGFLKLDNRSDYNDVISVYSGNCENLVELICTNKDEHGFDGEVVYVDVKNGDQLMIRVAGISSKYGVESGNSCLSASWVPAKPTPANMDILADAIGIFPDGACVDINSQNANQEDLLPSENDLARADVWLRFDCESDGDYMIESDANFSESITIYTLDEADTTEVSNNNYGKFVKLKGALADQTYAIQVAGIFASLEGEACLKMIPLAEAPNPSNDCIEADLISLGDAVEINNMGTSFSGIYPSCNVYSNHDVWYKFTTTDVTPIYIASDSDFPHTITIYRGQCNELEEIWCGAGKDPCAGFQAPPNLQPNQEYFLQISTDYTFKELKTGKLNLQLVETIDEDMEVLSVLIEEECLGGAKASLTIYPLGGSGNYSISGYEEGMILSAGEEYLIVVTDDSGCEVSKKGRVGCQPSNCMLAAETTLGNLQCFEGQDGYIFFDLQNAAEPVTFEWNDENIIGGNPIYMDAGTYSVTITDANLCVLIQEFILDQPEPLLSQISIIDESGPGQNDGSATVMTSGGIFPYSYAWSNGETTSSITNLEPGNYSLTISDALGCPEVKTIGIDAYNCVNSLEVSIINTLCSYGEEGAIVLNDSLETIASINWEDGSTSSEYNGLAQGDYNVTITLLDGCEFVETYTVQGPEPIDVQVDNITGVLCNNEANGSISLSAEGGTGILVFSWPDGNNSPMRDDLSAGEYMITTTDENACEAISTITMTEPNQLVFASSMIADVSCPENNDGAICVFVSGGIEPYDFDWGDAFPAMSKLENLAPGTYALALYDANDCMIDTVITVGALPAIAIEIIEIKVDESNASLGAISIDVQGGTKPYTFQWFLDGALISEQEDPEGLINGLYTLMITDSKGCIFEDEILVQPTSVNEINDLSTTLFPNPARDALTISTKDRLQRTFHLRVINVLGKVLFENNIEGNRDYPLDLSSYSDGAYFVELVYESQTVSIPFVVVK